MKQEVGAWRYVRAITTIAIVLAATILPFSSGTTYPWRAAPNPARTLWVEKEGIKDAPNRSGKAVFREQTRLLKKGTTYRNLAESGIPDDYLESFYRACASKDAASLLPSSWRESEVVCP